MNDQLQSKLVEILSGIQVAAKTAGDFAIEQLPDIAQQYVLYGRISYTALALVAAGVAVWSARSLHWNCKPENFIQDQNCSRIRARDGGQEFRIFVHGLGTVIGSLVSLIAFHNAALVWFAPKIWLLKQLATLVGSGQ